MMFIGARRSTFEITHFCVGCSDDWGCVSNFCRKQRTCSQLLNRGSYMGLPS